MQQAYAFCESVSALIASASMVLASAMICSIIPMTPPAPEDCSYFLKPGGGGGPAGSWRTDFCTKDFFAYTAFSTFRAFVRSFCVARWSAIVVWKSAFSACAVSPFRDAPRN